MSKFVQVSTQLRRPELIQKALDDLKLRYSENGSYRHRWSGETYRVPFLIQRGRLKFGLRTNDDGVYEAVGDDMQISAIRSQVHQISQRYAYHAVVDETSKAGFELVEESVGDDHAIHLTVRRWR